MASTAKAAPKKAAKMPKGTLPSKRSINLALVGEEKANMKLIVPVVLLVIVAALLVAKFAVVDRIVKVNEAKAKVNELQQQVDEANAQVESYGDLTTTYAHYTYSDLTDEEMNRTDRLEIIDLINTVVMPQADVKSWTISGNRLDLPITGQTLQQINLIAQQLEADSRVEYCVVTTAASENNNNAEGGEASDTVTAQVSVYLYGAQEGGNN